jgi:hypothetical protein
MPKIVVEGPDGRKFAFPDTMPRAQINEFMRTKYGTKARDESVQDYLARFGREQAATEARAKDIDREATAVGRAEGERAAERMGVSNPLEMAFAAPAIGLAQQEGGRQVFNREGTVLADEAAGLAAANSAGFFLPGLVNPQFGARVEEGRRQQPLAAFAGDIAGGYGPGEIIGAGVAKAAQAIGPGMAAVGRMFSRGPGPNATNAIAGGTLGGIAPAETAEERARNIALGVGLGAVARPASQMVDDLTRTGAPRAMPDAMPAGAGDNPYFGRQSMRPPGSGPSSREIETQQQWATATPIVTQARTTAQSAQQAADAALQSKAPADIARAKDAKKTLVGQLQEAQASRAGMDTPEDARLAETLASLTENTSDPVLLSTQISAAKTSLDRLLTDIGSPVEGNLIPVRTNILTRTQAPRSAAEGPQDRASVTRYAEGEAPPVKGMGFGASVPPKPVQQAVNDEYFNLLKQGKRREALRLLHKERGVTLEDSRINRGGAHSPPSASDGAPGYDVASNGIYPDDLYSANGRRYYGTGDDTIDGPAFDVIRSMEASPNKMITIYRSVEKGAPGKINPGDWVTTVRKYAKDHGEANIGSDYKIIKKTVAARDIFTDGNSVAEWGYSPQPMLPSHRGAYTEDLKRIPGEWKPVYGTDDDLPPIKGMGFGASTPKTLTSERELGSKMTRDKKD